MFDMTHETLFHQRVTEMFASSARELLASPVWEPASMVLSGPSLRAILDPAVHSPATVVTPVAVHDFCVIGGVAPLAGDAMIAKLRAVLGTCTAIATVGDTVLVHSLACTRLLKLCTSHVQPLGSASLFRHQTDQFAYNGKSLYATRAAMASLQSGAAAARLQTSVWEGGVGKVVVPLLLQWLVRRTRGVEAMLGFVHAEPFRIALGREGVGLSMCFGEFGAHVQMELGHMDVQRAVASFSAHRRIHVVFTRQEPAGSISVTIQDPAEMDCKLMPVMPERSVVWNGAVGEHTVTVFPVSVHLNAADFVSFDLHEAEAVQFRGALGIRGFAVFILPAGDSSTLTLRLCPTDLLRAQASFIAARQVQFVFARQVLQGPLTVRVAELSCPAAFTHKSVGAPEESADGRSES